MSLGLLLALACQQHAITLDDLAVSATPAGLSVSAAAGVERVTVLDPGGVPLLTRRLPEPLTELTLMVAWPESGAYTVQVVGGGEERTVALAVDARALSVTVEAPLGQDRRPVEAGEVVEVTLIDGQPVTVAVAATAIEAGDASLTMNGEPIAGRALRAGERLVGTASLDGDASVTATVGGESLSFSLETAEVSLEEARRRLRIAAVDFPADAGGRPDVGRPPGRVTLPGAWWRALLQRSGLGSRARDPTVPWGWYGVTLENSGSEPVNVALQLVVTDEDGEPAAAFRPRVRDADDRSGVVRALLRVPAGGVVPGSALASLPLYVDESLLSADDAAERRWSASLSIYPLGSDEPLSAWEAPLYVSRGSTVASAGLALAVALGLAGAAMLARMGPRWLATARTSDLTTIALFGALSFLVSAVGRLLSAGVAAALGPFSTMLTALVDDALRYALMATLLTLLPRPGTATLAALTGWLLSGLTTGGVGPAEVLYITGRVAVLEGALWVTGVTRRTDWVDGPPGARWLRLSAAFASTSLITGVTGIAVSMVLYRLFYADWFIAMLLGGPGFLYVLVACWLAVPFADSLRQVQR